MFDKIELGLMNEQPRRDSAAIKPIVKKVQEIECSDVRVQEAKSSSEESDEAPVVFCSEKEPSECIPVENSAKGNQFWTFTPQAKKEAHNFDNSAVPGITQPSTTMKHNRQTSFGSTILTSQKSSVLVPSNSTKKLKLGLDLTLLNKH